MDVMTGECLKVDSDTDTLTAEELREHEREVIEADRSEIASFLEHGIFKLQYLRYAEVNPMDCVWIRKWKWKNGKRIIKCRLCVRGFLDPQKTQLGRHSSTATRLSQRMVASHAMIYDW